MEGRIAYQRNVQEEKDEKELDEDDLEEGEEVGLGRSYMQGLLSLDLEKFGEDMVR